MLGNKKRDLGGKSRNGEDAKKVKENAEENENENENADDIVLKTMSEELDIEIKENDLDRTHRIGNRSRKDYKP